MQKVSKAYKSAIKKRIRNRGYIQITIGIINQEAQKKIQSDTNNELLYLCDNPNGIFEGLVVSNEYATCEEDYSRVDGKMFFTPTAAKKYFSGIITDEIDGSITFSFQGSTDFDIRGLTIDFSDCYPTEFTITNDAETKTYTNNARTFRTEDTFDGTSFLTITPISMVHGNNRLRIYGLLCGVSVSFTNNDLITYSEKNYVSPISETIPSNDVTFTVDNQDLYYCPDDPESAIAYLEEGQEVAVKFGYDIDDNGTVEWLDPIPTYLKTWKADEYTATFTSTDRFDTMSDIYYKGMYREEGITLYDLAEDVFEDAGIEDYHIDYYLKDITVYNPLPPVSHTEALQIIANAARSTLYEDKDKVMRIATNFVPSVTASSDNATDYSHTENILITNVTNYAEMSYNYTTAEGVMLFGNPLGDTGYISEEIADANGNFTNNPTILIEQEAIYSPRNIEIEFANVYPSNIRMMFYQDGTLIDTINDTVSDEIYLYDDELPSFSELVIEFTHGSPNARVFVNRVSLGTSPDYDLRRGYELVEPSMAMRANRIQSIDIIRNLYSENDVFRELSHEKSTITPTDNVRTVYFSNPSYGFTVYVASENATAQITEYSNYYATIQFTVSSSREVEYSIIGSEYDIEQKTYSHKYHESGEIKEWNNPIISDESHAQALELWLAEYFLGDIDYEIEWRGDPRTEANDLFNLETVVGKKVIRAYENSLTFSNAGWKGQMKARKVYDINELDNT